MPGQCHREQDGTGSLKLTLALADKTLPRTCSAQTGWDSREAGLGSGLHTDLHHAARLKIFASLFRFLSLHFIIHKNR